jgi:ectoine hydroxylase-related dioxygenase (phytanoyl-CoA dioxygenase family)
MMTCWFTLDDTRAGQGTIEYVRGSHLWSSSSPIAEFHVPNDSLLEVNQAATAIGRTPEIVAIEVPAGSLVIHHGSHLARVSRQPWHRPLPIGRPALHVQRRPVQSRSG